MNAYDGSLDCCRKLRVRTLHFKLLRDKMKPTKIKLPSFFVYLTMMSIVTVYSSYLLDNLVNHAEQFLNHQRDSQL